MENKPRILPLVWLLLALLAMAALHGFGPQAHYLGSPWNWLGLAPMALGLWMAGVSAWSFERADTGLVPFDEATTLVTQGFFRFTRNPMYLGMVVFLLGVSLIFACLPVLLPVIAFTLIIHHVFILREEQFMEQAFGDDYLEYKRSVRRWI